MTSKIARALGGAQLVQTYDNHSTTIVMVWNGGTQTNVYNVYSGGEWDEIDVFSLSDENGEAVSREEMSEHMEDWAQNEDLL